MTKTGVDISCIIPTHARPDLLSESIRSVLDQTVETRLEIIVVDDLGDEATKGVVTAAADDAVIPIRYAIRSGRGSASASRNLGAELAEGEYLAFLDDDDLWDPNFLAEALKLLSARNADMVFSWLTVLDTNGVRAPLYAVGRKVSASEAAARNPGLTGSNFLIKKSVFGSVRGFDPDLPVSNDKDFLVRFLLAGYRYEIVPQYLAVQRQHAGPRLTDGDERRAAGIELYIHKHSGVLTWSGKRYLRKTVHRIYLRSSKNTTDRLTHALGFISNLSPTDLLLGYRRRAGRVQELR
jgi:glycosyltransferase involved in cell wall biosynthesis